MSPNDPERKRLREAFHRLVIDVEAKFPHLRGEALVAAEMTIMLEAVRNAFTTLYGPDVGQLAVDEAIRQVQERRRK